MEENIKIIKEEVENLLEKIDSRGTIEVSENDGMYSVHIDTDENALLIGKHGNTLSSLELVLAQIVAKKTGEFKRIVIEVGGYREAREDYLRDLSQRLHDEVIETGSEKTVRGLKPWERRVIHMHLAEFGDVNTESEGEERDRVLVISKK
jgi:spoIIIJ-associated protein